LRAILLASLGLALASLLAAAATRWALPLRTAPPTGPLGVATRTWAWVDERPDALSSRPRGVRSMNAQLWYGVDAPFRARIPETAELPEDPGPVVVIVHGALGTRHSHLSLAHELASHGFAVVAADHPGAALLSREGRFGIRVPPAEVRGPLLGTRSLPTRQRLTARAAGVTLPAMTADALFLRERAAIVLRRVDRSSAYIGYGLGGLAALAACAADPTCATAITLDAPTSLAERPPQRPILAITSAAVDPEAPRPGDAAVDVPDSGTLDLTDLPLQVRGALLRAALSSRHSRGEGRRGVEVVRRASVAWLRAHLGGEASTLQSALAPWPDVRATEAP
jgi:dienelactone hydrolase